MAIEFAAGVQHKSKGRVRIGKMVLVKLHCAFCVISVSSRLLTVKTTLSIIAR